MYIFCHHKMLFILYEMLLMLPYRKHKSGNRTQERPREREIVKERGSERGGDIEVSLLSSASVSVQDCDVRVL